MTQLPPEQFAGVVIYTPQVFGDRRGFFMETYQQERYREQGIQAGFVQDNLSRSCHGTLRGLHYQRPYPQGKLCYVLRGEVFDVFVDLRRDAKTFGRWGSVRLSEADHRQIYLPPGFAHGFYVMSESADFAYKCTDYHRPECEQTLLWNDINMSIDWPCDDPQLSDKDRRGRPFREAVCFEQGEL